MFQTLHATSQDGSSLAFFTAAAGRECNTQDARGRGLCYRVYVLGKVKPGDKYRNGEKYSLGIGTHMDTTTI